METIQMRLLSPLEKIFPDRPAEAPAYPRASALWGEETAFQAELWREGGWGPADYTWRVNSPLGAAVEVFRVETVPCDLAAYPEESGHDDDYITLQAGLFPDLLRPLAGKELILSSHRSATLWVNIRVPEGTPGGDYPITLTVEGQGARAEAVFTLRVVPVALPAQKLLFTQWFHVDCLAEYYGAPVYSEAHWRIIGNYLRCAAKHGINTILTPLLTPPLDTEVGGERLCTQLAAVEKRGEAYTFDLTRLERFIRLAQESGITHFEVCQLFSQWGAKSAPNVYATVDGEYRRLFGWETPADAPEYRDFLRQLLPRAKAVFEKLGLQDRVLWHISDEPHGSHLETYRQGREFLRSVLGDVPVIDAVSDPVFYDQGLVKSPVAATDCIEPFLQRQVPDLWAYYCCGQTRAVGNRFLAMPSYRNRVLGLQLYKFKIQGFLHWGFNFWHSWHSRRVIDPYRVTDADGAFPGGDAFSVYPGEDGQPLCSLRLKVFLHALQDLRAMELLEQQIGRPAVEKLIDGFADIRFGEYPRNAAYYLAAREKINEQLGKG